MSDSSFGRERQLKFSFIKGWELPCYLTLTLLAGALVAYATPFGLLIWSGDSVCYIEGARNILAGHGFSWNIPPEPSAPVVVFPPLYSMAIAAVGLIVHDPYTAARWVSVACFALSVFLLCLLVWRVTDGSLLAGLTAGLIFFLNPDLIGVFTAGLTETIFIPLGLAGQLAFSEYVGRKHRGWLVAAALCLGLSAVARFSGVVWVAAGTCAVLLCARGKFVNRLREGILFLTVAMLPPIALAIRNRAVSNGVAGRSLILHPFTVNHFREELQTISSWFLPWRLEGWVSGIAVAGAVALLVVAAFRKVEKVKPTRATGFWVLGTAFSVLYLLHLPVAISLVGYDTAIVARILAPVEVCVIGFLGAWLVLVKKGRPLLGAGLLCGLIVLLSLISSFSLVKKSRLSSGGYRGPLFNSGPYCATLRQLPRDAVIYSNKPEAIYVWLERPVISIPYKNDPMTLAVNTKVAIEMEAMKKKLQASQGVIVYFPPPSTDILYNGVSPLTRLHEFTETELKAILPLQTVTAGNGVDVLKLAAE